MNTTTIGLDIAKRIFQAHGTDARGKSTLTRRLKRAEVLRFFANLQPCLIGIEACASAHHWARKLCELGHTVKLIAPQFVKPYVKTNKNDARDAEAICAAVSRPNMRFVRNPSSYKAVIEANESGRPAVEKLEPFHPGLVVIVAVSRGSSQRRPLYTPCACVTGDSAVLISATDRGPIER